MRTCLVLFALVLLACGGSAPSQPDTPDANPGQPDSGFENLPCDAAADCDDGADCTTERCSDEGICVYEADDSMCDNADMCDGTEVCGIGRGCVASGPLPPPALECRQGVQPHVVAGAYHSCAVDFLGYVRCWGAGIYGQLGYGEYGSDANVGKSPERTPATVGTVPTPNGEEAPLRYVVQVVGGTNHTCALLSNGEVLCWGLHTDGQLGYGLLGELSSDPEQPKLATPRLQALAIDGKVVEITSRNNHTCALLEAGTVRCWGRGGDGQLGYPTTPDTGGIGNIGDDETLAGLDDVNVGGTVVQISAGGGHTCALLEGGTMRCWGTGDEGVLGYGNTEDIGDFEPPAAAGDVPVGGTVVEVSAGGSHTCALLEGGTVRCWGRGDEGQLGYGLNDKISEDLNVGDTPENTPELIGDVNVGGTVVQIAAGGQHTCALLDDGDVRCWGDGSRGQLGLAMPSIIVGDDETPADLPPVNLGGKAVQISAGAFHTCALLEDGMLRCWGLNQSGQLGYGHNETIGDTESPADAGEVLLGTSLTSP